MSAWLAAGDDSLSASALERVDRLCDALDAAWRAGQRPRIEDYLGDASGGERDALLRWLIPQDVDCRKRHGETPDIRYYLGLSPTLSAEWLIGVVYPGVPLTDRYQVGAEIDRGGIAEVRMGHDRCLDRPVAVKILLEKHLHHADLVRRFENEARITSRLQHPGIVPVFDLGASPDGRPSITMKLVKGHTLAKLLRQCVDPDQDLPRFLSIFEQICQTLAYAHTQGIIRRDLKPHNIRVGAFGEVHLMDWGFAKDVCQARSDNGALLSGAEPSEAARIEDTVAEGCGTQTGLPIGSLPYMPPEQARGEVGRMDQRSDVFGLGAILCEILLGAPPFRGANWEELWAKAKECDHWDAMAELDACGADAELLQLAKGCLSAAPEDRPRNAGAVAESMNAYLEGVRERLRAAERERAAAQARAEEAKKTAAAEKARAEEERKTVAAERRARRRMVWASLAVFLLVFGVGSGAWWQQRKQEQADTAVEKGLEKAELLAKQAQEAPLEAGKYRQALEAARVAADLARGASDTVRRRAEQLVARLEREEAAAERDRRLLAALLEVHGPREGPKFSRDDKNMMLTLAEPSAEELFASAFRDWGLDVDTVPVADAAARLKGRPAAVVTEVIAALDEWASQRRQDRKPEAARRVAELAAALDDDPGSLRHELREVLTRGQLSVERALGVLSAALRPVPVPVEIPLGRDRLRLRRLAEKADPANEPILGLLTLTRALRVIDEEALAERLLRAALAGRPREVVLYHTLGQLLTTQKPPHWGEAVVFYQAARGLRPDLGVNLAEALLHSGHASEGLDLLARMVHESPDNPYLHFQQGPALYDQGRHADAEEVCRKAIALKPDYANAYINLGAALNDQGKPAEAEAAFRKAIALKPDDAEAYINLGAALADQGKPAGAEAACRKAIALQPDYANAYINLGGALQRQGRFTESLAAYRRVHELGSKQSGWRHPSLQWVRMAERLVELEKKLPSILSGEESPGNPGQAIDFAWLCQQPYQKRYAASARLYADAFAAEPKLAADLKQQYRYHAACSAALAGTGQGEDARLLPDKVAAMFRRWALGWLRDDLTAYGKLAGQNNPAARRAIHQRLAHWQSDPDLASLREKNAVDKLHQNERDACRKLWSDVADLLQRTQAK
jgi:serine/threonine-protein kinase